MFLPEFRAACSQILGEQFGSREDIEQLGRVVDIGSFAVGMCFLGSLARELMTRPAEQFGVHQRVASLEIRLEQWQRSAHRFATSAAIILVVVVFSICMITLAVDFQFWRARSRRVGCRIPLEVGVRELLESEQYEHLATNSQMCAILKRELQSRDTISRIENSRLMQEIGDLQGQLSALNEIYEFHEHQGPRKVQVASSSSHDHMWMRRKSPAPPPTPSASPEESGCRIWASTGPVSENASPDLPPVTREEICRLLEDGKQKKYRRIYVPGRGWQNPSRLRQELEIEL